jgi:hypothetical protein
VAWEKELDGMLDMHAALAPAKEDQIPLDPSP